MGLGEIEPGREHDIWLDIQVPSQSSTETKEKTRKRDKVAGMLFGSKDSKDKDVQGCQVHVKVGFLQPWMP